MADHLIALALAAVGPALLAAAAMAAFRDLAQSRAVGWLAGFAAFYGGVLLEAALLWYVVER